MSVALLGDSHRIIYEAKNYKTGLTDITATVTKPNGSPVGPFTLIEFPNHPGLYYFDLGSAISDPIGDWAGVIVEGTHKSAFKCTFLDGTDFGGGGGGGTTVITDNEILVEIEQQGEIEFLIQSDAQNHIEVAMAGVDEMSIEIEGANQIEIGLEPTPEIVVELECEV